MSTVVASRLRRSEQIALWIATGWGAALLVAAMTLPMYSTVSGSSDGAGPSGYATLVGVNGAGVLVVVGMPLLVSVIVSVLLRRRAGQTGAGWAAWALVGLLCGLCLLALLSIGLFFLPVAASLVCACVLHKEA